MSILLGDVACHCTREQFAAMRFDRFVMHLADGQRSFLLRCPAPRPKEGTFSWRVPPTFPNLSSEKVEVTVPPNVKPGESFAYQAPDTRVYKLRYAPALHWRARRDDPAATSRRRPHQLSTRIAGAPTRYRRAASSCTSLPPLRPSRHRHRPRYRRASASKRAKRSSSNPSSTR